MTMTTVNTLDGDQKRSFVSPLPRVFGRALCDEAYYLRNVNSMTTHTVKDLKVQSLAYLTSTPMINGAQDLSELLTLAWDINLSPF